ncbi:MAG: TolC family outer membrane protein [Roseitalea sp.]|jgi:outer membrane protein|nr:TolC family outer membrane protein [Roseitalea sp.]MBO6723363.1 TolC family outer membrane protein [Roseitalea sp.]MBO6745223.1 TolC family outer membrane protein [Roseitalea sp.]
MRRVWITGLVVLSVAAMPLPAWAADTIHGALAKAYENNAQLNSARAGLRVTNEGVPLARSGMRPRVTGTSGIVYSSDSRGGPMTGRGQGQVSFGIEINQAIFDGFQTRNNVQAAEAGVRAERQNLRNTEQNVLFDTAQAYMDVVQNRQIANLRARNLEFLQEQLRAARARFEVGEGTRTDVAQAEASLAGARAQLTAARASVGSSEAVYRQLTGVSPGALSPAQPLSRLLPNSLDTAYATAFSGHPAIKVRDALVDSSLFSVKAAEGAFLPQIGLNASLSQASTSTSQGSTSGTAASIGAQVTVPIYQGGQASATVRQRKEELGQARIDIDVARDQVRAAVASAWTQLEASRASLSANQESVRASQLALNGVIEERNVGQRTTLDVLNAQATVLDAQVALVQAQRNLVVSSYALGSSVGRLTASRLGLNVRQHDPEEHYNAVKDLWYGLRTPDGR